MSTDQFPDAKITIDEVIGEAFRQVFGRFGLFLRAVAIPALGHAAWIAASGYWLLSGVRSPYELQTLVGTNSSQLIWMGLTASVVLTVTYSVFLVCWHYTVLYGEPLPLTSPQFRQRWPSFIGNLIALSLIFGVVALIAGVFERLIAAGLFGHFAGADLVGGLIKWAALGAIILWVIGRALVYPAIAFGRSDGWGVARYQLQGNYGALVGAFIAITVVFIIAYYLLKWGIVFYAETFDRLDPMRAFKISLFGVQVVSLVTGYLSAGMVAAVLSVSYRKIVVEPETLRRSGNPEQTKGQPVVESI